MCTVRMLGRTDLRMSKYESDAVSQRANIGLQEGWHNQQVSPQMMCRLVSTVNTLASAKSVPL